MNQPQPGQRLDPGFCCGATAVYNGSGLAYFRHKDWLGSSRLATTWQHGVYSKEAYAPFGEAYNEAGTVDSSFTGQDQDSSCNSTFVFRRHDPVAGRWLSPDPSGWGAVRTNNPQSLNRYTYLMNNPMAAVDPNGLSCSISDGSGGGDCSGADYNGYYVSGSSNST